MILDKTTEAIAHFIGLFDVTTEAVRLRKSYDDFLASRRPDPDAAHPDGKPVEIKKSFDLDEFDPGVVYMPTLPSLEKVLHDTVVTFKPLPTKSVVVPERQMPSSDPRDPIVFPRTGHGQLEPIGSVATLIHQQAVLSDNDYASVGQHGLVFQSSADPEAMLSRLVDRASELSPLWDVDGSGASNSTADLIAFIDDTARVLREFAGSSTDNADTDDGATTSMLVSREPLGQSFVNGVAVTGDLPKLEDYLHHDDDDDEAEDETPASSIRLEGDAPSTAASAEGGSAHGSGAYADQSFVDVSSGGNTLVNTAQINNQWAAGHVIAAVGTYHQIDAIVQANIWSDQDAVDTALNGWRIAEDTATQAFNIAMFKQTDLGEQQAANLPAPGQFPTQWAVTAIHGDLTILAWIEQLSFMMDNDIAVLSSSGVKTTVSTGDNMQLNDVLLQQIGRYFDLIIVGGNIYDANIISQTNILLDDDLVGGVNGFQTTGAFDLSTQGNLLWNAATIHNLYGTGGVQGLPNAYREAANNFAAGNETLPSGVMNDPMFAGLGGLRVLYVTGDYINLQYIKQTNILGDSDQVALAMNRVNPDADAHWTVATGSNQLINLAAINDVDFSGRIYAGGQAYSDAMLVQAELVSSKPSFGTQDPGQLVNEAVAFLQDSQSDSTSGDPWQDTFAKPATVDHHGAVDPMHSMLS